VEVPGTNGGLGSVASFLVITKVGRVMRIFRIFKVFRLVRLYNRLSQVDTLMKMMVYNPGNFIMLFLVFFSIICSLILKMLEQHAQVPFQDIYSVLWYTIVTVTTIGYGDLFPTLLSSRIVMTIILLIGMGMIGSVSSNIAARLMTIGKVDEKVKKVKMDNKNRVESYKQVFDKCYVSLNPYVASIMHVFFPEELLVYEAVQDKSLSDSPLYKSKRRNSNLSMIKSTFKDIDGGASSNNGEAAPEVTIGELCLDYEMFSSSKPLSPYWTERLESISSYRKNHADNVLRYVLENKCNGKWNPELTLEVRLSSLSPISFISF
jgi:hypothetical protein